MELRYRVVDVFSDQPLAGNALCVVLDPAPEHLMAALAREVNLSETTFVTGTGGGSYDVRIFTPSGELPFAGHPTLGTAWALGPGRWTQRSPGATVEVVVDRTTATMAQPDPVLTEVYPEEPAVALGLGTRAGSHAFVVEVGGIRHLLVATEAPLDGLQPDLAALRAAAVSVRATGVGAFRPVDATTVSARVFVPASSVPEDPGTGSAAGAIGVLAGRLFGVEADLAVEQGAAMGRPCRIEVHVEPGAMRVGGRVAACASGTFTL